MDLYNGFDSNYRYILVAARRARQLQSGASPLVVTESTKPCRIAAQELEADKVKWETIPLRPVAVAWFRRAGLRPIAAPFPCSHRTLSRKRLRR